MKGRANTRAAKGLPIISGDRSSRLGRSRVGRAALVLAFVVLGYLGTSDSIARVVLKADPAGAKSIAPGNGKILARYAQHVFSGAPTSKSASLPANLARRALLVDPTAVEALTVLGLQAQLRGDYDQANRIFFYSSELSRRELRPRLWGIEAAIARGDITAALRNYDVALRTSREASKLLFPILNAALAEPRIRSSLIEILGTNPVWKDQFIAYAATSGIEPEGAIALFKEGRGVGLYPNNNLRANLVNTLMAQNKTEKAWAYYNTFRPSAKRDRSRDSGFKLEAQTRTVFDWRPGADTRLAVGIFWERGAGLLDFSVPPSIGGELASQTQLLPPGNYQFVSQSKGIVQPFRSKPYWSLTCEDGRELGRIVVSNSAENQGVVRGRFTVPKSCPVQILKLIARSTDNIMGVSGQIEQAQLLPLHENY